MPLELTDSEIQALRIGINDLVCRASSMAFDTHKGEPFWLRHYETLSELEKRLDRWAHEQYDKG